MKDANNLMLNKNFSIADDITCTIDGVENSNYWKIKNVDNALIYLNKEGKISKLIIDSKVLSIPGAGGSLITTDRGIIESITYTRTSAPKITMMSLDGKMKEYFIKKDLTTINILIFDEEHYVYDLKPGMNISIELENEEIIKLTIN